jgi:hypothetical protein
MTAADEEKPKRLRRTYQNVESFAETFDKNPRILSENADRVNIPDPLDSDYSEDTAARIIGKCVSRFFRMRDGVNESIITSTTYPDSYASLSEYRDRAKSFHQLVDEFHAAIQQLKSHNLIEENADDPQLLKQRNAELETRIVQLSKDLKKCRDDFEAYKKAVKPFGNKGPEYGVVGR